MNYIWVFMVVVSYVFSVFAGNTDTVTKSVFDGCEAAVTLTISLLGMMCMWTGLLEVAQQSGLTKKIQKLLLPIIRIIFPKVYKNSDIAGAISMSITANLLGLSNAATPLGIYAMEKLEEQNSLSDTASDEMCMFVVMNSASITLIPATLLTLRASFNSSAPFEIMVPVWIASLLSLASGIACAKIFARRRMYG